MPELTIQVHDVTDQPGTTLVTLNGSIDAKTVITFQTHLNTVKERGASRLVLDMENVKYVNSTGLGFLINLSDSISSDRGEIALVKVQPRVKVVLDMLGLNSFFKIYSTCEEALKQLLTDGTVGADDPTRLVRRGEGSPFGAAPEPSAPV
ncbi:MAG: STAS domain-containing protein, partial [Planctomycetes bacterium]|nr:STAS domain-containing protein [Planctomycetota bacterium]